MPKEHSQEHSKGSKGKGSKDLKGDAADADEKALPVALPVKMKNDAATATAAIAEAAGPTDDDEAEGNAQNAQSTKKGKGAFAGVADLGPKRNQPPIYRTTPDHARCHSDGDLADKVYWLHNRPERG